MRNLMTALLVGIVAMPLIGGASELTGVCVTEPLNPYRLRIDGTELEIELRFPKQQEKDSVQPGDRLWVDGQIQTEFKPATPMGEARQQSWEDHWCVFMEVKQFKKIAEPFERPKDQKVQNKPSEGTR